MQFVSCMFCYCLQGWQVLVFDLLDSDIKNEGNSFLISRQVKAKSPLFARFCELKSNYLRQLISICRILHSVPKSSSLLRRLYTVSHKRANCNLVRKQWILTLFLPLDLGMNDAHKGVNFAHLALLNLLHYLVQLEILKMHMNALNYVDSFTKSSDESLIWTLTSH